MIGWGADLRQSARALLRAPGFSLMTIATLAIGIGTASGVFSIVETILLRPLPMEESDRLVALFSTNPTRGAGRFSVSYPDFADLTGRADLFESATFYMGASRDISGEGEPERVRASMVHERFFDVLRSDFVLGRGFGSGDHGVAAERTAVLSEDFWARRFGSDSTVVGRSVRLDGVPHVVVGVVRGELAWPSEGQVWVPLQWGGTVPDWADSRSNHTWQVVARLQPDVPVNGASDQVAAAARMLYSGLENDTRETGIEAVVVRLNASRTGGETSAILGVMGTAVFLVLLVACLNASGLLLTRAWRRAGELSVRSALGAGRVRIAMILMLESFVLALIGGVVGLGLAHLSLRAVVRSLPLQGPDLTSIEINPTVAAGALLVSVFASVLAGAVPAWRAARIPVAEALKEGGRSAGQGRSGSRLRHGLVVAELALSLALLVSAGLTVRGFQRQIASDPGFDASGVLTFTVRLPGTRYGEEALVDAYYRNAIEALERHPGVVAATSTSRLPLGAGGFGLFRSFTFDGAPTPPEGPDFGAAWVEVDPGYFRTLGLEPTEGRGFRDDDDGKAPLVAIVNRRLAGQMSPEESMVGRRIRSHYDEDLPRTVVGVIDDLQFDGLARDDGESLVLVPRAQATRTAMAFMVRTSGDPLPLVPELRATMAGLDGDVALDAVQTLVDAHGADLAGVRFLTTLFTAFGLGALLLAVSGVYGLVSFSVTLRTREIGIRVAMGATASDVRSGILRESAVLAAAGLAIGVVIAYGFSRLLASALFGLAEIDPATFAGIALALAAAVILASWFPAMRATRVDPVEALRSD